ncbi:Elongation factor 1-gamma [Myotis davidii]|uniref:Elongation factor 1-gamma n=1 Tax=Myotis davidii TaxID=225400 RepID=L5M590_MYODS|nr:Elongation factor 1-gamma [Myotis davidii]
MQELPPGGQCTPTANLLWPLSPTPPASQPPGVPPPDQLAPSRPRLLSRLRDPMHKFVHRASSVTILIAALASSRRNISLSEKKKAAAPAPEEEMDECEQALAAEPKAKDPFAHVPKSTFVLEEFKSKYSNEDTLSLALPYFWEHFDKDGWSRWYAEYRFPEELTQTFTSCNLMTGMFQRLDKLRKNAFASVILFETNNSSSISGVWAFQGQELAFPLSPDWQVDYEKPKSTRHICVKKHFVMFDSPLLSAAMEAVEAPATTPALTSSEPIFWLSGTPPVGVH